jgi:hypothetical protein
MLQKRIHHQGYCSTLQGVKKLFGNLPNQNKKIRNKILINQINQWLS